MGHKTQSKRKSLHRRSQSRYSISNEIGDFNKIWVDTKRDGSKDMD